MQTHAKEVREAVLGEMARAYFTWPIEHLLQKLQEVDENSMDAIAIRRALRWRKEDPS